MSLNEIQPGEYIIANFASRTVLDIDDGKVIGYPYAMSASQTWTLATDGNFWTVQNSLSKRYLGVGVKDKMKNGTDIREVEHAFSWLLEPAVNHMKLAVPYSGLLLDLYGAKKEEPGGKVNVWESYSNNNSQKWVFSRPRTLPIEEGSILSLVNVMSGTAVTFDANHTGTSPFLLPFRPLIFWNQQRVVLIGSQAVPLKV
ncbi:hypothetical protein BKA70DRAFT_1323991 [Coprinopsis sp. MPI-PUGE-AT-0042]|nr:hypothetical protein BKA70DRAFT_1323991 [Coprinopsis sp. MPI-PUGE-AT-0042]